MIISIAHFYQFSILDYNYRPKKQRQTRQKVESQRTTPINPTVKRQNHNKRRHRKNRKKGTSYVLDNSQLNKDKDISFVRMMAPNDDLFIEPAGDFDVVYGNSNNT